MFWIFSFQKQKLGIIFDEIIWIFFKTRNVLYTFKSNYIVIEVPRRLLPGLLPVFLAGWVLASPGVDRELSLSDQATLPVLLPRVPRTLHPVHLDLQVRVMVLTVLAKTWTEMCQNSFIVTF